MLNRVRAMQAQFIQIEGASPVRPVQEVSCEFRHEEAEGRREVKGLPDGGVQGFERDVLPIVRQDAVIGHGIYHWTGGSGITFDWGVVRRPSQLVSWRVFGDNMARFERGSENVEDKEAKVPA